MKILHAKSPCCRGEIIKFGSRRYQCVLCRKTWRRRHKRRGRKKKRTNTLLIQKYLQGGISSLHALAQAQKRKSEDQLKRELRKGIKKFLVNSSWPQVPANTPLIAIADAMISSINKKSYAFYFILIKTVKENKALIMPPYCQEGAETALGWQNAFNQLPKIVFDSICALVSDSHSGLVSVAKKNNWIVQRCHFHIIARIQGRRSHWVRSRHRKMGEKPYSLVKEVLTNPNKKEVALALKELSSLKSIIASKKLRGHLSGLIRYYPEYRSYLKYPNLNLPTTTNSAESVISGMRKLCHRAHGFRTIDSLSLWIEVYLKHKRTIVCNGYSPTKFPPLSHDRPILQ